MTRRVPRYLHLPVKILWFDMEDIAIGIVLYVLWLVIDQLYVLPLFGFMFYFYYKLKIRSPRGLIRHILYDLGFIKLSGYPTSRVIRFEE